MCLFVCLYVELCCCLAVGGLQLLFVLVVWFGLVVVHLSTNCECVLDCLCVQQWSICVSMLWGEKLIGLLDA